MVTKRLLVKAILLKPVAAVLLGERLAFSAIQPPFFQNLFGKIVQNQFGPCPFDAGQGFQDDRPLIDPALLTGGFDHGIFAADLIGGNRHIEVFLEMAD